MVLSWLTSKLQPPLPPLCGGSFPPVPLPISGVLGNEAYGGSPYSPFPVFPLPVASGWNAGPRAFSRASHPAVASDACQERERALSTRPELTVDHSTLHSSYLTHTVRPHVAPRFPSGRGCAGSRQRRSSFLFFLLVWMRACSLLMRSPDISNISRRIMAAWRACGKSIPSALVIPAGPSFYPPAVVFLRDVVRGSAEQREYFVEYFSLQGRLVSLDGHRVDPCGFPPIDPQGLPELE